MAVVGAALSVGPSSSSKSRSRVSSSGGPYVPTTNSHQIPSYHAAQILPATFEVFVAKDTFKFNAAHFVAFEGYRERLHGHNYTVSVRLQGSQTTIGPDGYVIDYGNIKKVCKEVCKDLNEHFLLPSYSDVLNITHQFRKQMVRIDCPMDGTYFEFPTDDCKFLPIVHATTEELAIYLWSVVMQRLDADYLLQRGIVSMELTVAEAPGQQATFRYPVQAERLDVRKFIQSGPIVPMPCLDSSKKAAAALRTVASSPRLSSTTKKGSGNKECGPGCGDCIEPPKQGDAKTAATSSSADHVRFSAADLESLINAMKAQGLLARDVTAKDIQAMVQAQQD